MSELIVDSFAGGGGASLGIEMALGRSPDIAINHDAEALAMHAANHPDTLHLPHNVWKVDPYEVTRGRPVGLLWASPDCKHFSKAKGGKPVKRNIRDLAWVVVRWAKQVRPRVILLENVEEFRDWGPLGEDGRPCPDRRGQTFDAWTGELRRLGYRVEHRELRACDYGAPTIRKRLFLIARRDGRPIVWPAPTHGKPDDPDVVAGRKLPWRTAAEIIDWSLPCHSIFLTREEGRAVGVNRPLAENTMARVAKGVKRYVLDAKRPFIVDTAYGEPRRGSGGYSADAPLSTLTGSPSHAVVSPFVTKFRSGATGQDLGDPLATVTANSFVERPGGAVPLGLVAPVLTYAQQGGAVRDPAEPLHTVTASRKDQNAIIAPHLMTMRNAGKPFNGADEPAHTVTAGGAGLSLVAPYLVPRYGERPGQEPRTRSVEEPAPVVVPTANGGSLAAVHLQKQYGRSTGSDLDAPVHTLVGKEKHAVVAAFLAQHNTDVVGHAATEPVSTIVQKGSTQAVVSAGMISLKGSDRRSSDVEEPARTVLAGGGHAAEVRAFLTKYYGPAVGQAADDPLHTATAKARFGLVTVEIDGEFYAIADIGMRMLAPRELFRAQGFPDAYVIETGRNVVTSEPVRLTKTAQVRMCGNSVCPPMAAALVAANYNDAIDDRPGRRPGPLFDMLEAAE